MCTLWQRIRRAARDRSLDAIAVVFVEAKYFDEYQEEKAAVKKRKVANTHPEAPPPKRLHVAEDQSTAGLPLVSTSCTNIPVQSPSQIPPNRPSIPCNLPTNGQPDPPTTDTDVESNASNDEDVEKEDEGEEDDEIVHAREGDGMASSIRERNCEEVMPDMSFLESRRQAYADTARRKKAATKGAKKAEEELDPEVMDFVNAGRRGLGCHRVPVKLVFRSEDAGEKHSSQIRSINFSPHTLRDRPPALRRHITYWLHPLLSPYV